ncbi:hypothetical protein E3J85_01605 [Patescibacteria group bacterium]|nr:MAG: hypothetical protein E3J85_01605 [Patescibacteria group bacterium]
MKTKIKFKIFSFLVLGVMVSLSLGTAVLAASGEIAVTEQQQDWSDRWDKTKEGATGNAPPSEDADPKEGLGSGKLPNFARASSFRGVISLVINALLAIASTIAVIFIIIGGYQYVTSGSNSEAQGKAKKTLVWAVAGLVAVILSAVVVNTLISLFGS